MEIRPATGTDVAEISALIKNLAHFGTLRPDAFGAEHFMQSIEPAAIANYLAAANIRYCVGRVDGSIAGVSAMRDNAHLLHLFVAPQYQCRGYSRDLWEHARAQALAAGGPTSFTVNSTRYAVPVYQRFGFVATAGPVEQNGIAYVPMQLQLSRSS